jgi:hypothetical protein
MDLSEGPANRLEGGSGRLSVEDRIEQLSRLILVVLLLATLAHFA